MGDNPFSRYHLKSLDKLHDEIILSQVGRPVDAFASVRGHAMQNPS